MSAGAAHPADGVPPPFHPAAEPADRPQSAPDGDDAACTQPAEPRDADDLPDAIADAAAERLLAAKGAERSAVLAALLAVHPQHAPALHRLDAELSGAERLLVGTYPDAAHDSMPQIGGHRVLRQLGEGAFGTVFLCAQEHPIVRQVAIKVLRPGAGDEKTLRRFAAERQLLASLNHSTITQVFDAGVLPDGRPFFVMEFIDGLPMRRYCEERGLPCHERLRLFVALCRGVAHAHKRGIVHRDLKPANVLVVDTDGGPQPKIIDFGIAKALSPSTDDGAPRTDAGRVLGTPGYMSPEQALGQVDEIDERSDVFALGVMLYELLTGELPWPRGAAATDTDPVRPSARVTTADGRVGATTASQRQKHAAELRGDLDWITLAALARNRDERYASATDLADDLERHLHRQPVSVGPPSTAYRVRKFVLRNRSAAIIGGAALFVSAVAAIGALVYARAAGAAVRDARDAAAARTADATAAVEMLLARANDPRLREAPGSDALRGALLQDGIALYERLLADRPNDPGLRSGRCRALLGIAHLHWLLGEAARSRAAAADAAAEAGDLLTTAPDDVELHALHGEAVFWEGSALAQTGNQAAALAKCAAAAEELARCATAEPSRHWRRHVAARRAAARLLGPGQDAQRIAELQGIVADLRELRGHEPELVGLADELVETSFVLGSQLRVAGQLEAARAVLTQAEAELASVRIERDGLTFRVYQQLADIAWDEHTTDPQLLDQRYAAAMSYARRAVEAATAWKQAQPDRLLPQMSFAQALGNLAFKHNYSGEFEAASSCYRQQIALLEEQVRDAPDDPGRATSLARALAEFALTLSDRFRQCDLDEAGACADRALALDAHLPPGAEAGRVARWQLLALRAVIEGARWKGDLDPVWLLTEPLLPTEPQGVATSSLDALCGAWLGVARWHFDHGRMEAAAIWRARARKLVDADVPRLSMRAVELGWLEARAAAAAGDHRAAAAAADRIRAARRSWLADRRAADCLHLAWRCTRDRSAAARAGEAAEVEAYDARAAALYGGVREELAEDVAREPDDPWFVLPWGFASVRAAELAAAAGDQTRARELLDAALPKLAAVRAAAHADQWDEGAMRDGQALVAALAAGRPRR